MKLFKRPEPSPYHPYFLNIERADKAKQKLEFGPIIHLEKHEGESWLRKFCEKLFSRQKHKLEQ